MWSVWPERIELYLGPGVAVVRKLGTKQAERLFFPDGMAAADMLAQLTAVVSPWLRSRSWHAQVALSGAWCPAVCYEASLAETFPEGHWQTAVEAVDRDMATGMAEAAPIAVRMDARAGRVASGCPQALLQELEGWCRDGMGRPGKLVSVQPVWACATHAALVRRYAGPVLICDPAAVTLLVPGAPVVNKLIRGSRYWRQPALIDALTVTLAEGGGNSLLPAVMHEYAAASEIDLEGALWMVLNADAPDGQDARALRERGEFGNHPVCLGSLRPTGKRDVHETDTD